MEGEKGVKGELKEVRGEEESGNRGVIVACWFGLEHEWYSESGGRPLGRAEWVLRGGVVRDGGSCCSGSKTWGGWEREVALEVAEQGSVAGSSEDDCCGSTCRILGRGDRTKGDVEWDAKVWSVSEGRKSWC